MSPTERILGEESPSDSVMGIVRTWVQEDEHILAVAATSAGGALVATDQRILAVEEEGVVLDSGYEDITDLEVRTRWWSRGISLKTREGEAEYGIRDRDAVMRMGNIIGDRASGVDVSESDRGDGGLMDRAKGVLDTATGQDIRKFEEFVEAATTVLVGVHRDQQALRREVTGLEEAIRERQDGIDERLGGLDATITAHAGRVRRLQSRQHLVCEPGCVGHQHYRTRPLSREYRPEVRVMAFDEIVELASGYTYAGRGTLLAIGHRYRRRHEREVLELAAIAADVAIDDLTTLSLEPDENPLLREAFEEQYHNQNVDELAGRSAENLEGSGQRFEGEVLRDTCQGAFEQRRQRGRNSPGGG